MKIKTPGYNNDEIWLNNEQAAKFLNYCVRTLSRKRKDGKISYYDDDGRIRFRLADLQAYVKSKRINGTNLILLALHLLINANDAFDCILQAC